MTAHDDVQFRREVYTATNPRDAADERQSAYYVPIYERPELSGHDVVRVMRECIEFSIGESLQVLSGFRGSGKTSELHRLRKELEAKNYKVVLMDAEDYFNTELPVDLETFPLSLAAGFLDNLQEADQPRAGVGERLKSLLRRINIEPATELTAGLGPVSGTLKVMLQDDERFAGQVRVAMKQSRRAFREALHQFFRETAAKLDEGAEGTVFIVDSIDHFRGRMERFSEVRESVERLFSELADELRLPGLHVIYTVPIYVQPVMAVRRDVLNVKVCEKDGDAYPPGVEALRDVLARRVPDGDLERLLGDQADRVIQASGGLIRDLLRLTGEVTLRTRELPVTERTLVEAESVLRQNMDAAISREQVEILRGIQETHQLTPAKDQWPDATDLMAHGAVLKYPNGTNPWYGVHPLLKPSLD